MDGRERDERHEARPEHRLRIDDQRDRRDPPRRAAGRHKLSPAPRRQTRSLAHLISTRIPRQEQTRRRWPAPLSRDPHKPLSLCRVPPRSTGRSSRSAPTPGNSGTSPPIPPTAQSDSSSARSCTRSTQDARIAPRSGSMMWSGVPRHQPGRSSYVMLAPLVGSRTCRWRRPTRSRRPGRRRGLRPCSRRSGSSFPGVEEAGEGGIVGAGGDLPAPAEPSAASEAVGRAGLGVGGSPLRRLRPAVEAGPRAEPGLGLVSVPRLHRHSESSAARRRQRRPAAGRVLRSGRSASTARTSCRRRSAARARPAAP